MNPAELKLASAKRPHGTRARYASGCRCLPCRAANSRYESERLLARRDGDWNGVVCSDRARRHIEQLQQLGIGYKQIAATADLSSTIVWGIKTGARPNCRARTERLILAVDGGCAADRALVDARPTWRRIESLIADGGFSKAEIARRLGYRTPKLQLRPTRITAKLEHRIRRFWEYYIARGDWGLCHKVD